MAERKYTVFLGNDEIGVFTVQEIHEKIGIEKRNICKYAYAGTRYRGKYQFVVVPEPRKFPVEVRTDWQEEWDAAAVRLREVIDVEKRLREVWDMAVRPFHRRNNGIWRF
ncbi:hypothetical protein [Eisenbergiella porci]|uniref:hypothetical protein n=1 Tax=Eisenbergiella porci TaxID=2652274 RepID=UPI002A804F31|nr:hypothetical protein [Eisenbergiella porci]